MISRLTFLSLCLSLSVCIRLTGPSADKVSSLPNWPDFTTNKISMYSGYLETNSSLTGKSNGSIHYTFIESLNDPTKDPLVLWLNGGPGCSSLFGLFQEFGPYLISGANVVENKYTWLKNASILAIESPFGVGFSYNTTEVNLTENDTAVYNYYALLNWFVKFPEFKAQKFWITGESYAGMYIPYLSSLILNNSKTNGINFKGIMVGNGVLLNDNDFNNNVWMQYLVNHNLFSPQIVQVLQQVCPNDPTAASCQFAQQQVSTLLKRVNPYDIYGYCSYSQASTKTFPFNIEFLVSLRDNEITASSTNNNNIEPCLSSADLESYLNLPTVQTSLHIDTTKTSHWYDCNDNINENYVRGVDGSLWLYPQLISAGLNILIYSGDTDSVVSYLNTQMALANLNLNLVKGWSTWHTPEDNQVGGYVTVYKELTYTTIRGAGHMVPQWKPIAAYHMFANFLNGTSFN